jgi:Tannase and feruloyl esterase
MAYTKMGAAAAWLLAFPALAQAAPGPAECTALANLQQFPITPTRVTLTQFNDATATLPAHCRVQGIMEERTGVRGIPYGTRFELRLPADWNGRFMFQGGGGTQGSLPAATGNAGTLSPTLAKGFAVASDNGGHDNSQLTPDPNGVIIINNMFYDDPQAVRDWAYRSVEITTRTAKYLIRSFYGAPARYSYFVGCSTSGRQGIAMAQDFARHYDGIVAGDPFFVPPHISLSETWTIQQVKSVSPLGADGKPVWHQSYSVADRELFTRAILEACDALDGLQDGVIDNHAACRFDPAKFRFAATGARLQCTGAKTDTCLSPAQVNAIKKMADSPRTSWGRRIVAPNGWPVTGYPYDGGWMEPSGIPARNIGTPTSPPGNLSLGTAQLPLFWFTRPDPTFDPVDFDWDRDMDLVVKRHPGVRDDTDLSDFRRHGGKIIFYHGMSDSGPPWTYTAYFYDRITRHGHDHGHRHGRDKHDFARLYMVPNMGHCSGGPSTDRFDFLTPLMAWVEERRAPGTVVASGVNFKTAPTTRNRPLCPYPQTLRYTGPAGGDIAAAENYTCREWPAHPRGRGDRDDDDDDDD